MGTPEIDIPALAAAYRRLVLWFGVQLLLGTASVLLSLLVRSHPADMAISTLSLVISAGVLATIVALAHYGYRTARALTSEVPWLWSLAMFVPYVNVITLLILSSKATTACRANGIPVGFFGPRLS